MRNLYFGLCAMLSSCVCHADQINRMPVSETIELTEQEIAHSKGIAEAEGFQPMLFGGRPVEEGELLPNMNVGFCSVTVVGPETFVSAGHCHSTGSQASFTFKGARYNATCTRHPDYNNRTLLNDFALCKFSPKADFPKYGNLGVYDVEVGTIIVMNGYGKGSSGGRLHVGKMPVSRIVDQELYTSGNTVLGSGDSGSSAYLDTDLKEGPFKIVSVNSRAGGNMSILNRTGDPRAQSFFKDWASRNNAEICGVNKDCIGVKPPDPPIDPPPPPPKPEPPGHCVEEKSFVKMAQAKLKLFEEMLAGCK